MHLKTASKDSGFTLIELMVTLVVLAILMSIAVPSMVSFFDRQRVIAAAEEMYSAVQQARVESLARSTSIHLDFVADGTGTWRYGMGQGNTCDASITDLTNASACTLVVSDGDANLDPGDGTVDTDDLILMVYDQEGHQDVLLSIVDGGGGTSDKMEISNIRGIVETGWGTAPPYELEFTSGEGKLLRLQIGKLGQVRLCTPDDSIGGYSTC